MFHTLQDYTAHVKDVAYIMAGIILLLFVPFWYYLTKKVTRKKK